MCKLVTEDGTWLTDERLNRFNWRAGARIYRGPGDTSPSETTRAT